MAGGKLQAVSGQEIESDLGPPHRNMVCQINVDWKSIHSIPHAVIHFIVRRLLERLT